MAVVTEKMRTDSEIAKAAGANAEVGADALMWRLSRLREETRIRRTPVLNAGGASIPDSIARVGYLSVDAGLSPVETHRAAVLMARALATALEAEKVG